MTRLILFDLDGTLYLEGVPYPGAIELIKKLRKSDLEYCFVTNNSSIPSCDYCEKLRRIGFPLEPRNVTCSGDAAVWMLRSIGTVHRVHILGGKRLKAWMAGQGFPHTPESDHPDAVLVAFDKDLTYEALAEATRLVLKGVPLYATHADPICPPALPDAGMLLNCLKSAKPGIVVQAIAGKPHRWFADMLQERFGIPPCEMAMVGDRVNTDMTFAQNCGMKSILVLNGEPMPVLGQIRPTIIAKHIAQLLDEYWPHNLGW